MPLTGLQAPARAQARRFHPLRVAEVRRETDDAISLSFDLGDQAEHFHPRPGQYLTLRARIAGEEQRRSYSICSGPGEPLRIAIKRVDDGRFSTWAHTELAPGHVLDVMPPEGRFAVPPAEGPRHLLAIAAGSGITPILAILKSVLPEESNTRATLLYGSRSTAHILFREDLEALKDRYLSRLAVTHVLSREQQDIPVLNGRLDPAKLAALLPTLPDLAIICGPAELIDAATAHLVTAGMDPAAILSERFTPSGTPRPRAPAPPAHQAALQARITADGTATTIPMNAGETVLDAALRAGLDLPYSCRAGMCSTCRARVTEGAATMDVNYGLEPWETDAGYVLTCQARPTTPTVAVDYDQV